MLFRSAKWLEFALERFGDGVMPGERLDRLMSAPIVSHLLVFEDSATGGEVGTVLLYLQPPRVANYSFAFYALGRAAENLGMFMMTRAVEFFSAMGLAHLHLGTCYDQRALYKIQFAPIEYFTGWRWSTDLEALKSLVRQAPTTGHLLEDPTHPAGCGPDKAALPKETVFRVLPA